jgi:hypothetical protein
VNTAPVLATLQALEQDTHIHIHKENNILFPAGIAAEDRVARRDAARREARDGTDE